MCFQKAFSSLKRRKNGRTSADFQQSVLKLWEIGPRSKLVEYSLENLKKVAKKVKKSVDKSNWFWYYVKALERAAPKNRLMTGRTKHFVN